MKTAMMNKSRSLLLLSVLAVLFAACEEGIIDNAILSQDYTEPEYAISVSPGELSFPAEGGEEDITLELTRSLSWTATTNDSWITLPTHSGDDSPTSVIHILVAENTSLESRTGTITFKTRGKTATLTVRQEGVEPFLSTDVQTLTFPSDGGAQQVQISTNGNWTATTKVESAFSVSPASGTGEGTLTVTAAENETAVLRWETLTLTSGTLTVSITLLQQAKPDLNGHAYVDLALPSGLLWATCNVGATTPEEYGDYFAWGETAKKNSYTWANYKWSDGSMQSLTKYNNRNDYGIVDNLSELLLSDDAAVVNWGGCWRMPTYAEWEELCNTDNCTWTPINNNGHCEGYKVTSTRNGNSIFLPSAGLYTESGFDRAGLSGYFWASTLFSAPDQGCGLYFDDAGHSHAFSRYQGLSVRPVGKMTLHFSLMPTSVNFPAAGSSETLSITANQPWTVTTSDAWLTLSADAGTGDATLNVAAEENTSITRRTGAVTFQTGATTYTVTISQEGATPTFNVSPESLSFTASGGSASVTISSNQSWTATTSDAWFSISSAEGEGDATLSLTVVANTSTDSRSGTVTLKAGDSSYIVSVSQEGEDPILTISPESLSFSADGGNKSITVTSNLSWMATSSDAWLTVSSSSGEGDATLSVTADENVSIANRTASVTFEGKDRTVIVNVTQDGAAPFFNVTPTTLSFSAEGGSAPVKIVSNQTWTASKSADWIALSEVEGTGDATLSLTVDANTSTDSRSGTVAFQAGETYYHINLTQDGEGILFSITPESLSFTAEGGNETITVTSNLSWTVTSSDAWLTLSNSSGEGDATLTVVAQENTSTSSRSGILTFKGKDITFTVNVTQEGASPNFSVTPTTLSFTSSGGSQSVSIKSNQAWTASFDVSWLSLSTASGTGDATVSITAQANTSTDNRAGTVTFTSGGKTYTVTVIQDGAATHFEITPTTITFTSKGESKSISIMSNQPWTVSSDASWLKLSDNSGTGDATLSVTAEENTSTSSRSSTIIFKAGGKDYTVSVMQEGATPFFNVSPESLSFSSSSESKSITVTSNLSWAASSDVSWLTLSNSSGLGNATLTLTTEANTSTNSRSGTVTFSAGGKTYTVSVSQAGADPTFSVTPTTLSFTASAGSKYVSITSNTSWTASSDGSWLTLSKSAGEGNATLSLTVEENTTISSRSGTVTFKANGKDYTISIMQAGATPTFSITPTTLSFVSSGGNQLVTVTSNQSWSASSSVSWLTLSNTSGTGDATVSITAQANTSIDSRAGKVSFSAGGKTYTVTVTQEGVPTYFEITPTTLSFSASGGSKSISVMSNQPWTVSANASWLKLSDNSGTSDATLSVTAEENTTTSSRSGTITFKVGGKDYTVNITQDGVSAFFEASPTMFSLAAEGGNTSVKITSNQAWTASKSVDWISLSAMEGKGDATLSLTVMANSSFTERTSTVTFKADEKTYTVSVTQEAAEQHDKIDEHEYVDLGLPSGILWATCNIGASNPQGTGLYFSWGETMGNLSGDNNWSSYKFSNGDKYSLTKYNTDSSYGSVVDNKTILDLEDDAAFVNWGGGWRMPTDNEWTELRTECTWTEIKYGNIDDDYYDDYYHINYKVTSKVNGKSIILPNTGDWDENGGINGGMIVLPESGAYWSSTLNSENPYYAWGMCFGGKTYFERGGCCCIRPVNQPNAYFNVSKKNLDFASTGSTETLTLTSNQFWTASSSVSWLTLSNTSGTGDASVSITAQANTSTYNRSGIVTFTAGVKTYTVTISQDGVATYFEVTPTSLSFTSSGGSKSVSVMSNQPWTTSTNDDWITVSPSSGTSANTNITIKASNNSGVSRSGTVTISNETNSTTITVSQDAGNDGVFSGTYFTTRSLANNNTFFFSINRRLPTSEATSISYSLDNGITWNTTFIDGTDKTVSISGLTYGQKVIWKGIANRWAISEDYYSYFECSSDYEVEGNIMSLLYGDNFIGQSNLNYSYSFARLFGYYENNVINAENLILPNGSLSDYCFYEMFAYCKKLTKAPTTISASTFGNYSCYWMFLSCTNLIQAPGLPATTLSNGCYMGMFNNCTSLTIAPVLSSTTMNLDCYQGMFAGCTSLTSPPELPATTLAQGCYTSMFSGCSSLTTAPVLPAQTLTAFCYSNMFGGCTSLNYIKCLAMDFSANRCLENWVSNVSASGTFVKASSASWPTGNNGIPSSWTVRNAN